MLDPWDSQRFHMQATACKTAFTSRRHRAVVIADITCSTAPTVLLPQSNNCAAWRETAHACMVSGCLELSMEPSQDSAARSKCSHIQSATCSQHTQSTESMSLRIWLRDQNVYIHTYIIGSTVSQGTRRAVSRAPTWWLPRGSASSGRVL
jgi:hypothetical protein